MSKIYWSDKPLTMQPTDSQEWQPMPIGEIEETTRLEQNDEPTNNELSMDFL